MKNLLSWPIRNLYNNKGWFAESVCLTQFWLVISSITRNSVIQSSLKFLIVLSTTPQILNSIFWEANCRKSKKKTSNVLSAMILKFTTLIELKINVWKELWLIIVPHMIYWLIDVKFVDRDSNCRLIWEVVLILKIIKQLVI